MLPHKRSGRQKYPAVSIGCCFYRREPNYQKVLESIEDIATSYPGAVHAYIYLSDESNPTRLTSRFVLRRPDLFTFAHGDNRLDEPKYLLPLSSKSPFIFTLDDDCTFAPDTLTTLVDTYYALQRANASLHGLSPVGWFGTELVGDQLLVPIEGRYNLAPGELQQVDYLGSCGALFRRELLADSRLQKSNWPPTVGAASDLWLSFLLNSHYRTPAYITSLRSAALSECGTSLWEDVNRDIFAEAVRSLVRRGWRSLPPAQLASSAQVGRHGEGCAN